MKQRNALVKVSDAATVTSMPFNEFFLYRVKKKKKKKEILVSCCTVPKGLIAACGTDIEIYETGMNPIKLHSVLQSIKRMYELRGSHCVLHLHSPRSAFLVLLALIGTGLWKRVLFTVHSTFSGYKLHNKVLSFFCALLAEQVTCVSEASLAGYPSMIKRLKKNKIQAITNGVNLERIDEAINREKGKAHNKTICFAYVARMIPIKNHAFLLDIIQKLPSGIQFMFIGADDSEQTIRRKAEKMGLQDCIEFTGLIPREEVFRRLIEADVYISPSTLEGLPVSVLEAMYCGLPVLLSDIPPHKEVAKGNDFITVLPLREKVWIKEIERYVDMGYEERRNLGRKCRLHVKENFSLERMHREYDKIYRSLLNDD